MTLLVALKSDTCIVVAHDLKASSRYKYQSIEFKGRPIGLDTIAMFASNDVNASQALLERVNLTLPRLQPGDIYAHADALAETARRVFDATYGGADWSASRALPMVFVMAGWHDSALPVILELWSQDRFMPKACDHPPGSCWGDPDIADHLLWNHFLPASFMTEAQMKGLAVLLINEASMTSNSINNTPWMHVIRRDERPERVEMDEFRRLAAQADAISRSITNAIHDALGVPRIPPSSVA